MPGTLVHYYNIVVEPPCRDRGQSSVVHARYTGTLYNIVVEPGLSRPISRRLYMPGTLVHYITLRLNPRVETVVSRRLQSPTSELGRVLDARAHAHLPLTEQTMHNPREERPRPHHSTHTPKVVVVMRVPASRRVGESAHRHSQVDDSVCKEDGPVLS